MRGFVTAVVTGIVLFVLLSVSSHFLLADTGAFAKQVLMKLALALASVVIAVYVFRLPFSFFSLTANFSRKITRRYAFAALGLGIVATLLIQVLKLPSIPILKAMSFPQYLLAVWLVSSICEEVFARGLVQGIADTGRHAIYAGAIVFSLIHFSIYLTGGSLYTCLVIMLFTFVLGILAGIARQRSNLTAAIITHIAFNIGGFLGGIIYVVFTKLAG